MGKILIYVLDSQINNVKHYRMMTRLVDIPSSKVPYEAAYVVKDKNDKRKFLVLTRGNFGGHGMTLDEWVKRGAIVKVEGWFGGIYPKEKSDRINPKK